LSHKNNVICCYLQYSKQQHVSTDAATDGHHSV
jgi:hypothetical protein